MLVMAILLTVGVFVAIVGLVVALSGRRFPGDITGPRPTEIDYDNPYAGWSMWAARRARDEAETADARSGSTAEKYRDDFEQWEAEHWPREDHTEQ